MFVKTIALSAIPPVAEKTRGVKVPCSTSRMLASYVHFLVF